MSRKILKLKPAELALAITAVFIYLASSWLLKDYFYTELLLVSMLATLLRLIIGKPGIILLFLLPSTAIALMLNSLNLPVMANTLIMSHLAFGIILETVFYIINSETVAAITGSGIAAAAVPWVPTVFMDINIRKLIIEMINFTLASLFIGSIGALVAVLVWQKIQTTEFIIKLRC